MSFRVNLLFFVFLLLLHAMIYPFQSVLHLTWFGNAAQAIAIIFAAIQFGRAAHKVEQPDVHALNFIALGFWIFVFSHALLAYSELLLGKPATGTVTDAIWLCGYAVIARSLLSMTGKGRTTAQTVRTQVLMIVSVLAIVAILLWKPLMDPERSVLTKGIQFIFPFLDFWIATMALILFKNRPGEAWSLAAAGSFLIGVCDVGFPYFYKSITPAYRFLDIPLFAGYSLWWLAGSRLASHPEK